MVELDPAPRRNPGRAGWYPDPDQPTRERWWTGSEWTAAIAPLAGGPFGAEFDRAMRPAANPLARWVRFVAFGGLVALLVAVADDTLLGAGEPSGFAVAVLVVALVLGAAGAGLGWVASRRAATLGGSGAAAASIAIGVVTIVLGLLALVWP